MSKQIEKLKNKPDGRGKNGGPRPGSGRPKGSENEETRRRRIAERYYKDQIVRNIKPILISQLNIARGCSYLYKIETETDGKGNKKKNRPELVTNQEEIEAYLAGELEDDDAYYFITTERPDNKALDSMLDRVFGKATQNIGLDPESEPLTSVKVEIINGNQNTSNKRTPKNPRGGNKV